MDNDQGIGNVISMPTAIASGVAALEAIVYLRQINVVSPISVIFYLCIQTPLSVSDKSLIEPEPGFFKSALGQQKIIF